MTTRNTSRVKRVVIMGAIVGASLVAAVPTLTSATGAGSVNAATTTTKKASTSTTTKGSTTTTVKASKASKASKTIKTVANKYEVVAGIFATKAEAQAQIAALTKAKFTKFTIKPVTKKFAVVKASLTKAQATKLAKQINTNATLGKARVKKLP